MIESMKSTFNLPSEDVSDSQILPILFMQFTVTSATFFIALSENAGLQMVLCLCQTSLSDADTILTPKNSRAFVD